MTNTNVEIELPSHTWFPVCDGSGGDYKLKSFQQFDPPVSMNYPFINDRHSTIFKNLGSVLFLDNIANDIVASPDEVGSTYRKFCVIAHAFKRVTPGNTFPEDSVFIVNWQCDNHIREFSKFFQRKTVKKLLLKAKNGLNRLSSI